MRFLVSGYDAGMGGSATGIGLLQAGESDAASGALAYRGDAVTVAGSPSWVARHPTLDLLYAAMEGDGTVQTFRRTGESTWAPLGAAVEAGDLVCHVAVSPDGRVLLAACWGDGRVVGVPLDGQGLPGLPVLADAASDPFAAPGLDDFGGVATGEEPRVSRSHQSTFLPGGLIATTDLGFDLVRFWRQGADAGELRLAQQVALPAGTGPRHMVWHPSGHLYVVTELSNEVYVLAPSAEGVWRIVSATVLSPAALPGDAAAELCASHDAEFLYAGVRGSNTIAALRVRGDGSHLAPVALVESGVNWPRHHVVVHDTLLVAGQLSNEVVSLAVDLRTGVPGRVRHRVEAPSPTQLLALV